MKAQLQSTTLQTWLLAIAALATATVQSIVIREPETWTLCDQSNGSCDWPSDNNIAVKRRGTLDELLTQLADSAPYRSHIAGQLAAYNSPAASGYAYGHLRSYGPYERPEQQRQQLPFLSTSWKRQFNGLGGLTAWDAYRPSGPARSHRPLNGDKRARYAFSSWGGKRSLPVAQRDEMDGAAAAPLSAKREPAFSSWGGKRSQFFNWGGKRGLPEDRMAAEGHAAAPAYDGEPHAVMKRAASGEEVSAVAAEGDPRQVSKRLCVSDTTNLRQLLDEFVEWSRKQPEQKKASLYSKMMNVRTLHGSESPSRRAGAFYPWGGKRNSKLKDD